VTRRELILWRRWSRRRDARAFRALVGRLERFAYDFARRASGHDADAEDLAQEAFLDLADAPADRPPAVGLKAFLGRRIVLGARMLRRARLVRRRHEVAAARDIRIPQHGDAGADAEAILRLLPAEDRHAVELRFLHDLAYREVAYVLGLSEAAARMRVHRALKELRARLGGRAERSCAALGLVRAPRTFARETARAAVLRGGTIVMSKANKTLVAAALVLLVAGGLVLVRPGHSAATPVGRADVPRSGRTDGRGVPVVDTPDRGGASPFERAGDPDDGRVQPRRTGTVVGVIRQPDGSPLADAPIEFWGEPGTRTTTDAEGRFRMTKVPVGRRALCLCRDDVHFYFPIAQATLRAGATAELDIDLAAGGALEGTVFRTDLRMPVAGASVDVQRPGALGAEEPQGMWAHAETDAQGRFRFEHLPAGRYVLRSDAPGAQMSRRELDFRGEAVSLEIGLAPARLLKIRFEGLPPALAGSEVEVRLRSGAGTAIVAGVPDERGELEGEAPPPGDYRVTVSGDVAVENGDARFRVPEGDVPALVLAVARGARVEGRVDPPAEGLRVTIGPVEAETDEAGNYALAVVPKGTHPLRVQLPRREGEDRDHVSYAPAFDVGTIDVPGSGALRRDIALPGRATLHGRIDLAVPRYEGAEPARGLGEGSAGAVVVLETDDGDRVALTDTDEDGRFEIPFVSPGSYRLCVSTGGVMDAECRRVAVGHRAGPIDLGTIGVTLFPVPLVVTASPGTRLAGLYGVVRGEGTSIAFLDEEGRGYLRLPAGRHELRFTIAGTTRDVRVEVGATHPSPIRLDLTR